MIARNLAAALLLASSGHVRAAAAADDGRDHSFEQGSVLLHCAAPEAAADAPPSAFDNVFPRMIERLQVRANEGKVIRAHFLDDLRAGLFIVVGGSDREEAHDNAVALQHELVEIVRADIERAGATDLAPTPQFCPMLEIGPVAVLPM